MQCMNALAKNISFCVAGLSFFGMSLSQAKPRDCSVVKNKKDLVSLFSVSASELSERVGRAIEAAQKRVNTLCGLSVERMSYATVARELDELCALSDVEILLCVCSVLEFVTPDDAVRAAAHEAVITMKEFFVDVVENNKKLYETFKYYVETIAPHESLSAEQRYYLQETMEDFKRNGLDLPDEKLAHVAALQKEIGNLSQDFQSNISQDKRTIIVQEAALHGVNPDFIANLKRDDSGGYILGVDYPTIAAILDNCSVESTRKALYLSFNNRAYPSNQAVLERLIAARDELAQLLGMAHYNELCLADQMVQKPARAYDFLNALIKASRIKQQKEFQELRAHLPAEVTLNADGTVKPWDIAYIKNQYKKKYLDLDEDAIAQYFPMESTIDGLLHVYEQFFNLTFKRVKLTGLWHKEVITLAVYEGTHAHPRGYLLLDLHPRANKYTHACHISVIRSVVRSEGTQLPAVSVVLANFQPGSATKPALLKRDEVKTFFHEFGHALHAILGRTNVASFAGTQVKRDFVELPSQMLEQWLGDESILKQVSRHYSDGNPLPDELIAKIQATETFDSGYFVLRQAFYALVSLALYDAGQHKDIHKIWEDLHKSINHDIAYEPEARGYLSFGHLPGYGPRYYGYLWSKVFAIDMFESIKKEGLLNSAAGKRYVDAVLSLGGSKDPNELLMAYLGREPRQDAFLRTYGLVSSDKGTV